MNSLEENEIQVHSAIIPRKVDILQSKLPPYYSDDRNQEIWSLVSDQHLNLTDILSKRQSFGNDVFYKTDHHWTADGAYYAYAELLALFGSYSQPKSFFELELLSDSFYGTTFSKSGFFSNL